MPCVMINFHWLVALDQMITHSANTYKHFGQLLLSHVTTTANQDPHLQLLLNWSSYLSTISELVILAHIDFVS